MADHFLSQYPGDDRSFLEIEQELMDTYGFDEDSLSRFYPNIVGNGHPDSCLCYACAPGEYDSYEEDSEPRATICDFCGNEAVEPIYAAKSTSDATLVARCEGCQEELLNWSTFVEDGKYEHPF